MIHEDVYKKLFHNTISKRLTRCYKDGSECESKVKTGEIVIMCLCIKDISIREMFKRQEPEFNGLDRHKMLAINPHCKPKSSKEHGLRNGFPHDEPCDKKLFKISKEENEGNHRKEVMEVLWKIFICETRTMCCIVCRKPNIEYSKYCEKESHKKLGDTLLKEYFPKEEDKFNLVTICEGCSKGMLYCPVCKGPLTCYPK
eukprot:TRINITY_DN3634_c0_g3_i1.p1 TRINITY_DN3634_c0_g3~~TRINITY_DN3634_c0_g3_i1.p1  ORF type:complete len:200 (-),score=15.55 TRINITY_DN3634_c0_g3_i1:54-653(-)